MGLINVVTTIYLCSFSVIIFSQIDSTNVQFYSSQFDLSTQEDSVLFEEGISEKLYFDLALNDSSDIYKIWVDVQGTNQNNEIVSVHHSGNTFAELLSNGLISNNTLSMFVGYKIPGWQYSITIRIENELGHQLFIINRSSEL